MKTSLMGWATGLSLLLGVMTSSNDATAAGLEMSSSVLPADVRTQLEKDIATARRETPELFRTVQGIISRARALDAQSQKPGMPFTRELKALGPRALMPMLEALAFDAHAPADLPASASSALRLGLIEAVGIIRDARAIPVLSQLVAPGRDVETTRSGAEALSRIGTDDAFAIVSKAATDARTTPNSARERAVLGGLHDCRREAAAKLLSSRLDAPLDSATARVVVRSLGGVANAWAWKTMTSQTELPAVRTKATTALVRTFVRHAADAEVREAAVKALLVVDDPATPALVAKAKADPATSPAIVALLEDLERRFAANPTR
jgi:hypothetical protein